MNTPCQLHRPQNLSKILFVCFWKILEKSFVENPYPDPKKREELARLCNSIRSGDLTERERVTEQIVTHWFQNKRKLTRKCKCLRLNFTCVCVWLCHEDLKIFNQFKLTNNNSSRPSLFEFIRQRKDIWISIDLFYSLIVMKKSIFYQYWSN